MNDHHLTTTPKPKSLARYVLMRLVVGIVILSAFVYVFVQASITDQTMEFNRSVAYGETRLQERMVINEAALSGFANLLAITGPDNVEPLRDYTKQMRGTYDQIYMFEALLGIKPDDQYRFADKIRATGHADYTIYRYVSRKSKTGKPSKPFNTLAETPVMFPVFFIDPMIDVAKELMGFDMMSAKVPREPLVEALLTGTTQVTKPYKLFEGGMGYVLYRPLQQVQQATGIDSVDTLVATIVVLIDPMLAQVHDVIPKAEIALNYGKKRTLVSSVLPPNSNEAPLWTIESLSREIKFDKYGQPFTLSIVQHIGLSAVQVQLLIMLIVLLVFSFMMYLRSSIGRRNYGLQRDLVTQKLAQEHSLLEARVIERTTDLKQSSDENQRLANRIIRLQEDYSKHLARELHYDFGQILSAIKINAHIISQKQLDKLTLRQVQEIYDYSDGLYEKMHDLIQFLRPTALDAFGLRVAIRECLMQFKLAERGIHLDMQIDENIDGMEDAYAIATYRIVQELVNNTIKHAQATRLQVLVQVSSKETLFIQITDNGVSMASEMQTNNKGFGIRGVEERISILGGSLAFANLHSGGLQTTVVLPLKCVTKDT